ncbi:DUF4062 domain-containing protein [Acidithiobacillus sp.]|jgi:hypothetical protein|uniref:DUF4062 domain-containing protein n=1 Tax=Acidithiobacillus sp. TaxID=1872118 RepID=UPI0025C07384|nr:DUF4062 domain-containing protein [Acidithiobacillus sp.]MCK9187943.1 DUF4062 domain-containing protein [Acidithiobacillus sp.]MCK9359902.1 DUF4062 domain-containing protein [Acidithiobacillus sp.]
MAKRKKLIVMVSSTVYGIEELLERIYAILTRFGYEVWMSHKGTVPVISTKSAFENCLHAVEQCDLFLSLITTHYGSGKEDAESRSITHEELLYAIELNKPRWILAHDQVVFARTLLSNVGYDNAKKRAELKVKRNPVIDDLRVIDMYEAAIRHEVQFADRKGNWVQKFGTADDAQLYASAQFYRYQEVECFLEEHFKNQAAVAQRAAQEKKP